MDSKTDTGAGADIVAALRALNDKIESSQRDLGIELKRIHQRLDELKRPSDDQEGPVDNSHPLASLVARIKASHKKAARARRPVDSSTSDELAATRRDSMQMLDAGLQMHRREVQNSALSDSQVKNRYYLSPDALLRSYWELASIWLIVFISITLPYRLAFLPDWSLGWAISDFLIDIFFIVDVLANALFFAYVDQSDGSTHGELITERRAIFCNYARSWLVVDLCSSVPAEWFVQSDLFSRTGGQGASGQMTGMLRTTKLIKLLRLLRVTRLYKLYEKYEDFLVSCVSSNRAQGRHILTMLQYVLLSFAFGHWSGCVQFLLATFDTGDDGEHVHFDTWTARARISCPSPVLSSLEVGNQSSADAMAAAMTLLLATECASFRLNPGSQWLWCFYHAIVQLMGEFGVVAPARNLEVVATLLSRSVGTVLYIALIAQFTAILGEWGASARLYRAKRDQLHQFMKSNQFPMGLRAKLDAYWELKFPRKMMFEEESILNLVSHALRSQVALFHCAPALESMQVGKDASMARAVALALQPVVFGDGDGTMHPPRERPRSRRTCGAIGPALVQHQWLIRSGSTLGCCTQPRCSHHLGGRAGTRPLLHPARLRGGAAPGDGDHSSWRVSIPG